MEVGYVGLGSMGGGIVRRMLLSRKLRVYDLVPSRVAVMVDAGAQAAQNLAALAEASDVVCLCLPTSADVRTAIFGEHGLASGLKPGMLLADMTTGDPLATKAMAKELAAQGVELIDAPVSGGPDGAAAGTLAVMVGASAAQFAKIKPVFESIGPNIFHMGDVGAGQTMKLVNNLLLAGCKAMTYEVMALGAKNGLDPKLCAQVLQKSSGRNATTERTLQGNVDGVFRGTFSLGLMTKDVRLANQLGRDTGVPMLLGRLVEELHQIAMNGHGGSADANIIIRDFEARSGTRITK
jgi:3-hydroxyisobutyrate dehydrogenase